MSDHELDQIIIKFLTNTASYEELEVLNQWIQNPANESYFYEFVETHFTISMSMNNPDIEKAKKEFIKAIRKEKRQEKWKTFYKGFKYAAMITVVLGITVFMYQNKGVIPESNKSHSTIESANQVTLQLGNGSVIAVSPYKDITARDGSVMAVGDSAQLRYLKRKDKNNLLTYNKLMVPYGKTYNLILSDGTAVRLNAGSSLLFPVDFIQRDQRKVYLQGEAYFEVSHEADRPFYVGTQDMEVKVYGTDFNVKNYSEDPRTEVVLVDGAVSIISENQIEESTEIHLVPGDMGIFDKVEKITSKQEVDTTVYTAWLEGNMVIRDMAFKDLIKGLERSYNVLIINNNKGLAQVHFNANIDIKTESIEQVLNYFSKIYPMDYTIEEHKIIIN